MASRTYTARVLILRKTRLGESDLILTMLASDGQQLRAVAKGACKPTSSFAGRCELFCVCDVLCSVGKNLDILKEARLLEGNTVIRSSLERSACAEVMMELLDKITAAGLDNPKLFDVSTVALRTMNDASVCNAPAICSAHLLKALAFSGFRPSTRECVVCGSECASSSTGDMIGFSINDGGVVCHNCRHETEAMLLPVPLIAWIDTLLMSRFADIATMDIDLRVSYDVLQFCQQWIRCHVASNLKSLNALFAYGIFDFESSTSAPER